MNTEEEKFYKENCRSLSAQTFSKIKADVVSRVSDPKTTTAAVLLFADWLFHGLKMYWTAPSAVRKDLFPPIAAAIDECKAVRVKMKYLQWNDVEYSQRFMYHFYTHRFDPTLFIEQMLNDSSLLKWSQNYLEPAELRTHFIKWIRGIDVYEQRSNLLDVLLRFFPKDEEVQGIYREMMNGKTLYENEQNVHDEDISIAVLDAVRKLYLWFKGAPRVYQASAGSTRSGWITERMAEVAQTKADRAVVRAILDRLAIDKTTFTIRDENMPIDLDAFEILFMLLNFIQSQNDAEIRIAMLERLLEEMHEMLELCISGYVARFLSAVQGLTANFQILIPLKKQIYAKVNHDLSRAMMALPEESTIILGSYETAHKQEYYDFIIKTISLHTLYEQYEESAVRKVLPSILNSITGETSWQLIENTLSV